MTKIRLSALVLLFGLLEMTASLSFASEIPVEEVTLHSARDAVEAVMSGPLELVGRGMFNASIPSCLWRNRQVLVFSEYCVKQYTPAYSVQVYWPDGQMIATYVEYPDAGVGPLERFPDGRAYPVANGGWAFHTSIDRDVPIASEEFFKMDLEQFRKRRLSTDTIVLECEASTLPPSGATTCNSATLATWRDQAVTFREELISADRPAVWRKMLETLHQRAVDAANGIPK